MRERTRLAWCFVVVSLAAFSCNGDGGVTSTPGVDVDVVVPTSTSITTLPPPPPPGSTLREVQSRGELNCGVNEGLAGFTNWNADGTVTGFDPDFCRAIAAAVLRDGEKVNFVPLSADERFVALRSGEVDVLIRNTTRTSVLDAEFDFGPTTFHDSQRLMGRSDEFRASSPISELDGHAVCVTIGATAEATLEELIAEVGPDIDIQRVGGADALIDGLLDGTCDAVMADGAALTGLRELHEPEVDAWTIFPNEPISREPLGPVYRSNDSQWADIVNWTVFAMIIADENEVSSTDVADFRSNPPNPETSLLLGGSNGLAAQLELHPDAFFDVISQVGNYGEVFRRNLQSVGITRAGSLNASVEDLGLMTAPPIRAP